MRPCLASISRRPLQISAWLRAELALRSPKGRVRVVGPVAPGAAGEAVLEEHANDGHHSKSAVGDLRAEPTLPRLLIVGCEQRRPPPQVSWLTTLDVAVVACTDLAKRTVGDDL